MKKVIIFIVYIFVFRSVFAQTNQKEFEKAHVYYTYGEYDTALKMHYELHKKDSFFVKNNYYLGICYLETMQNKKALEIFKKIKFFQLDENKLFLEYDFYHDVYRSNHYAYNYARALQLNHEFQKAITYYQQFLDFLNKEYAKKYEEAKHFVEQQIKMCYNGIKFIKNPVHHIVIKNMGGHINSKYDDIAPLVDIHEHVLVFTSRRSHQDSANQLMDLDYEYMEDIYMSVKNSSGEWNIPFRMTDEVNTHDYHDAAVGLSASGCHLFIYRNNNRGTGDVYETHINDEGKWSNPEKLSDNINSKHTESNATISADGTRLFFTSNREGGFGKSDIYSVQKNENNEWGIPELLGKHINTPESEESPFLSPDGNTLYFSSKGHNSMGGFDIFKSEYNPITKKWSKAENLGYPINTADNDVYFVWTKEGNHAYFSSHHEDSYGEQDIYMMTIDTTYFPNDCNAAAYFLNSQKMNIPILGNDTLFIVTNSDSIYINKEVVFTPIFTSGKEYQIDHVYWKFGNSQYDCDKNGKTVYNDEGEYDVFLVMYVNYEGKQHRLKLLHTINVRKEG